MANTRETLATILRMLRASGVHCDLFGGWAEELLGLRESWQHGDIDLVYRGTDFIPIDKAMAHRCDEFCEVRAKRFRHKRAFVFHNTLCEIVLIQESDTRPVTYYWGDVPFLWDHPLLGNEAIELCGEQATTVSTANLRRHRLLWRETEPHRWRNPESVET